MDEEAEANGQASTASSGSISETEQQLFTLCQEYDMVKSPSEQNETNNKNKTRCKDKKICGVCGDKALGYNFDAISCESCKAFFRRNALKDKIVKCMFKGNCQLDINTRRFCSYCRLMKCLKIGMKKDMILGDAEKKKRLEKMKKNKIKRETTSKTKIKSEPVNVMSPSEASPPSVPSSLSSTPVPDELLCQSPMPVFSNSPQPSRKLTNDEYFLITEIANAYEITFTKLDENPSENSSLNQLVNASGLIVRRLIKFAKRLEDFLHMSQDCQIWLLKGVVLSTLFLRSAEHYNPEKDSWITPNGEIPTIVLKKATGYVELHEEHVKYCQSLKPLIQNDTNIMGIMQTISLFSPDRPNIRERESVSNLQDKYMSLLKHYLESRHSYAHARNLYPRLLSKLDELQQLTENHGKVLLHVNPNEIEPLMLEVFDLK
ncbi:vitamin D3 receptor B-like [Tubulanus polymorphus]|uniref:vitamin D3 receptor B-like n=1 Tax=Tubulanus polymorphus TaxID=672921 RepID=UPI003DA4AAA0